MADPVKPAEAEAQQPPAAGHDSFVAEGMAKFRAATSERLSHAVVSFDDLEAGIQALLSHLWHRRPADVPDAIPAASAAAKPPEGAKASG